MATISYDKTVEDFVARLSATGHVTHSSHKKTSVTLHHNGGVNLTHQDILNIWKTREASAHFDSDIHGSLAQYVNVNEYAWAVGNQAGNSSSISIEMANSKGSPSWEVASATWQSAARLAGWLFFHVIGARPSSSNFFVHSHWSATDCAGPYIKKIWSQVLSAAQEAYDDFHGGKPASGGGSTTTPSKGHETVAQVAKEVEAGKWGNDPARSTKLKAAGYDPVAVQKQVNKDLGSSTPSKPSAPAKPSLTQVVKDVEAGKYGNGDARVAALKKAGFDPVAVQAAVNKALGSGSSSAPAKLSVNAIAKQIMAGTGGWGNDPGRSQKLKAAGYDAKAVQAEVNRIA